MSMNMLDGSMKLSGEYNTKDIKNPLVDFDFKATAIDIPAAFEAFSTLQKFAPDCKQAIGKVSLGMKYSSFLDAAYDACDEFDCRQGKFHIGCDWYEKFSHV